MSVLIKGMTMPNHCGECGIEWCERWKMLIVAGMPSAKARPSDCPLVEVQEDDVRPVVHCKDCGHWNRKHQQTAKWSGNKIAMCAWWSRNYGTIQTATNDFCSYGYIEAEEGEENADN